MQEIQSYLSAFNIFDVNSIADLLFAFVLLTILVLGPEGIIREKWSYTLEKGVPGKITRSGRTGEEKRGFSSRIASRFARRRKWGGSAGGARPESSKYTRKPPNIYYRHGSVGRTLCQRSKSP